eukprot:3807759-Prymnesium_polylepis.1
MSRSSRSTAPLTRLCPSTSCPPRPPPSRHMRTSTARAPRVECVGAVVRVHARGSWLVTAGAEHRCPGRPGGGETSVPGVRGASGELC